MSGQTSCKWSSVLESVRSSTESKRDKSVYGVVKGFKSHAH